MSKQSEENTFKNVENIIFFYKNQ